MKEVKKNKNEMPLKHETYKGTFMDYRGMSRDFTMVAVSIPVKDDEIIVQKINRVFNIDPEDENVQVFTYNTEYSKIDGMPIVTKASTYEPEDVFVKVSGVRKMLAIGVAVRCNRDKDLGLGEYIAYGKALRNANSGTGHVMFVSHSGMINTKMVRALLEQEAEHFIKDPGSYIKGYNIDRDRYLKTGHIAMAELTTDEFNIRMNTESTTGVKIGQQIKYDQKQVLNETSFTPKRVENNADENIFESTPLKVEGNTYGSPLINTDYNTESNVNEPDVEPDIEPNDNENGTQKFKSRIDFMNRAKKK